jgi:hypothetical protein
MASLAAGSKSIAISLWEYVKEYTAFTQSLLGFQRPRSKISGRCDNGFTMHFHHRDLAVGTVAMAWTGQMEDQGSILSNVKHFSYPPELPDRHCSLSSLLSNGYQRIFS